MFRGVIVLILTLVALAPARADPASFGNWAAAVIAGDWRASGGQPTDAFENTRKDVTAALIRAGFAPENIRQFSPDPYTPGVELTQESVLDQSWSKLTAKAQGGCLFYVSSHGVPGGQIVLGHKDMLNAGALDLLLDLTCSFRPTVVVLSACFSGAFVPLLEAENRLILTAARPDRTSFGCGVDNRYPFFDDCILQSLPVSTDFAALAAAARSCVAAREKKERVAPPSEPQLSMGSDIKALVPKLSLRPK